MKNLIKFSIVALVILAGTSRYAQAGSPTLNGGSYHQMTPDPKTPHVNDANPQGPRMRNPGIAPEIDPGLAWSGIALLAGSLAVLGSRRKKAASL
jgi:LPXTG-motif cell wall-anchored protein